MDHCRRRHGSRQLFLRFLQHRETNFICFPLSNPLPPPFPLQMAGVLIAILHRQGMQQILPEFSTDWFRFSEILGDS